MIKTDITIIGAGPIGLFSIFTCGMIGLKVQIIETLNSIGGQCSTLYPEKPIYDIPAYKKITGHKLIDKLKNQASPFKPIYQLSQQVINIAKKENRWQIITSTNKIINSKALIIAAGNGAFKPKKPNIKNIEKYENHSIFYYIQKPSELYGKRITILGGGDSALDWCITLYKNAKKITLIHRRTKFRSTPSNIILIKELALKNKIDLLTSYQLKEIKGNGKNLTNITINDFDGHSKTIPTDILLIFFGLNSNLGPIKNWGIYLNKNNISVNSINYQTNLKGIFAIGDICNYKNKTKLIISGFAESVQAAYKIREIIHPNKSFHFEHSTNTGIPSS